MLASMGARITGIGSNILTVQGVAKLGGTDFRIGSDFMEVGSLIGLAAATRGDIEIEDAAPQNLRMMKLGFAKLGITWETSGETIHVPAAQGLKVVPTMGGQIPKIDDAPVARVSPPTSSASPSSWPRRRRGPCSSTRRCSSPACSTWTSSSGWGRGSSSAIRTGPWSPGRPAFRAPSWSPPTCAPGMAMLIAAMCAQGRSCIQNVYQIERGYENLTQRLQSLGARISRNGECAP